MELFEYKNYKLFINNPAVLLVTEFKEVMEDDNSEDKKVAFNIFTFLYLYYNWKSPYRDYSEREKISEALKDSSLTEEDLKKPIVSNACKKYEEIMNSSMTLVVIKDMKKSIDKFRDYFEVLDFTKTVESGSQKGTMLFKPKEYLDVMKRAGEIFESIKLMEDKLKEEMQETSKSRGTNSVGYFNQ